MKQEILSLNRGGTFLKGKNWQFTTPRNGLVGHKLIRPQVTSQQPLLLPYDIIGRGRAEDYRTHQTMSGQRQRKAEWDKGKVWRLREGSLIRFLGRMTKLCGMQWRGEREVIKSSTTKRGGKIDDRQGERSWLNKPGLQGLSLIHFPSHNIQWLSLL